jgi:hypothetical protein
MSQFIANSQEYNIQTENEISNILSHFNSTYIFDIIQDKLDSKFKNFYAMNNPNIVASFEANFKQLQINYPSDIDNIRYVRNETYKEIIEMLTKRYNLQFNDMPGLDYFSAAFHLYDFLVANFNGYLINFFSNYIIKEKTNLYNFLKLDEQRKNKDSSTLYGKKIFSDPKLAILNANLIDVISNICVFDIKLQDILQLTLRKDIADYIGSMVAYDNFFKESYATVFGDPFVYPLLLTDIRLNIQKIALEQDTIQQQIQGGIQ